MKKTSCSKWAPIGTSDRACKLLIAAMSTIEAHELRKIPQVEFCRILRISAPTLVNWTSRSTQSLQLEALLQLLERLPEDQRQGLLERFFRVCPDIDAPILSHEPATVTRLRSLLLEKRGLSIIQGGSDASRTFVFSAIGHAISRLPGPKITLSGIDLHVPDWFVPVDGLKYISLSGGQDDVTSEIKQDWLRANQGRWRMFSRVWSVATGYQKEILAAAQNHHVVVAEAEVYPEAQLRKIAVERRLQVRLLNVSAPQADRINVEFRSF